VRYEGYGTYVAPKKFQVVFWGVDFARGSSLRLHFGVTRFERATSCPQSTEERRLSRKPPKSGAHLSKEANMMVAVLLAVSLFVFAMLLNSGENQRHN
jgi:hypothetical protein